MEQLAPAARVAPQLFVWAKSPLLVPVIAILAILSDELVPLESATAWTALVDPGAWVANVNADGAKLTAGDPPEVAPLNAAKILPFQFETVYVIPVVVLLWTAVTPLYCMAMRTLDPLAPVVRLLFGIT
jgi:hypothetical protein